MTGVAPELLAMRDVHVAYRTAEGPLPAVRGVDLVVREGEVVGVAGESGCGKSTLVSTVLRLQPRDATVEGTVEVLGDDVLTMKWGDLRAVRWAGASIIFQGALHSLNPVYRVGRQIGEAIEVHEPDLPKAQVDARVAELLEHVGLSAGRARSYPHQLSGGQKQRVMIAMALACRPKLIVADEPTTALDVMVQAQVLDLLRDLVRDLDVGLLIISHDLSVLADLCDRVLVMYAGRVVEDTDVALLATAAAHPYTRALVGSVLDMGTDRESPLVTIPGRPPEPGEIPPGCAFAPRCPRADAVCRAESPALRPVAPGQRVACWHPHTTPSPNGHRP
jgi:peptide/nickel transport system ATP-binding protein